MSTETIEKELKYEVRPGAPLPSFDGLPQVAGARGPEVETLTAEYYDTEDLRLLRAGITLRRREGGGDEGWHLKLPGRRANRGALSRRELRLPLDHAGDPVPCELARLVRVHTRAAAFRPVARVETRRRRTTLHDGSGTSLAEIVADEVVAQTLGESTTLSRWNEVEVELTGGTPRLLRAADKRLRAGGLRPAGYMAKLERAVAADLPPAHAPAAGRAAGTLNRRSPSGEVVLAYLGEQAARLKSLDPAVRGEEADAVHQMRVTTRRLRATLQAYREIFPAAATGQLGDELKWLGGVLGRARDNEVLSEYLRAALAATPVESVIGPASARIVTHFAPREAAARGEVLAALDSPRYFAMLDELDRLLGDPPQTPAAAAPATEVLPAAVARAARRTRRRMKRARRTQAGPARDVALHETRKAAKRARYAAEAARPAFGRKAKRFAGRMKAIQSILGDHQDAVSARAVAREIGVQAHLAGENAFTFGLLHERAHRDAVDCADRAGQVWKRAAADGSGKWPK